MTSNDKDRPFISQCITGSSNSLPQDHFKKKCVQDLTCPLSRNWEHPQRFCLRWKDIYTSNTAFPERYLGRRSLQPAATQLHTGSTKIAGAVRRETWPGDARGLIQQNNRVFFFCFCHSYEGQNQASKPPSQWGSKPSFATHLRRCALWYILDIGVGMLLHTSLDRDRQRNLEDSSVPGRGDILLK